MQPAVRCDRVFWHQPREWSIDFYGSLHSAGHAVHYYFQRNVGACKRSHLPDRSYTMASPMSHSSRRSFVTTSTIVGTGALFQADSAAASDRDYWLSVLTRIAEPLLTALSQRKLKATMPVEAPHGN